MKVVASEFLKSATSEEGWPQSDLPEVAFAGRSNVGKSSMLNRLTHRRGLARVSNTPGRTRTLNFFEVTLERAATKERLSLCDLPGYGFAKVSRTEREAWAETIETYLARREPLRAVVAIVDAVVGPTEADREVLEWLASKGRQAIVVATKLDKIAKARRAGALRKIETELDLPARSVLGFSSVEGLGLDALWGKLLSATR